MNTVQQKTHSFDFLQPVRQRLESLEIKNSRSARLLCQIIPAQCPFARSITFCGRTVFRLPPLCKLNPLYEQLMVLRFKSLSYLVNVCGEDISAYC
jgi:hypothetical protein